MEATTDDGSPSSIARTSRRFRNDAAVRLGPPDIDTALAHSIERRIKEPS
ncbi:hypothetical protein [Pararobbsia silviterrae]|nr:hypothetical protein [Pararobbsia silviterrae]